ncbi:MAG: DegT/DnrJ/EryC1/StrS family aminotransferase [Planctomycetota bacterium]|nr:DegT/DnrJ/EryC1/StrS family aminotransferase [Planctomycetota bacterium]
MEGPTERTELDAAPDAAASIPAPTPAAPPQAPVPLMDPKRTYAAWGPAAEEEVQAILRSHAYVKGRHVAGLEAEIASFVGTDHAIAVDSGTDALYLVLRAVLEGRPAGAREVILPTFTFVATASAVVNAGGTPVFADVDLETYNLSVDTVLPHLGARTAAIVPVHLFGNPVDMAALRRGLDAGRAKLNGDDPGDVFLLEDAAQAIAASVDGVRAGALGDAATFSFYPSKNLGAAGDGGMVTTSSEKLAHTVRALRDHGQTKKLYDHSWIGTNSRMDEIQAAVLRAKLPHLMTWTAQRQAIAARYDEAFADAPLGLQQIDAGTHAVYHLYTVRIEDPDAPGAPDLRDRVRAALGEAGIGAGVYYPMPLHRQSCFHAFGVSDCPNADRLSATVLSLPCFPGLRPDEQERAIEALLAALD